MQIIRSRFLAVLSLLLMLTVLLAPLSLTAGPALAGDWVRLITSGFGFTGNTSVESMVFYRGDMYAGTRNDHDGCQVWSHNGVTWIQAASGGFGDTDNQAASAMTVYDSRLFVGTAASSGGCRVWSYDGVEWTQEVGGGEEGTPTAPGFGDPGNLDISSLAVYGGCLYAGTSNPDGFQVWRYDGDEWKRVGDDGLGDTDNYQASSMAVYGSRLYAGTYDYSMTRGCQVWSYDGVEWTQEVGGGEEGTPTAPGFGDLANQTASCMAVYGKTLYVGTRDLSGGRGCQVWSYDGAAWSQVEDGGFGDSRNFVASSMAANGLDLYVGTNNQITGCELWSYNGTSWERENTDGFGYAHNTAVQCLAMEEGELYAGTYDDTSAHGCEVWSRETNRVLYFAEGYTGEGFHEYICLGNPLPEEARAAVTYLFSDDESRTRVISIPADSRATVCVNEEVGADREVSVKVETEQRLVAERPMYFTYDDVWSGGHDSRGASSSSRDWYFAEGYTGAGFDEWICVLNPGSTSAGLNFRFQTREEGEVLMTGYSVPAYSRASFKVNEILGPDYQTSLHLESDTPVVAERPMYFDYLGMDNHHWQGGHCVMGAVELEHEYYFAEGTTREGFEEWLVLQNPNPDEITVEAEYYLDHAAGNGEPKSDAYTVPSGERRAIYVPDVVGLDTDVSVKLTSASPFAAERPMYFSYTALGAESPGGHCVVGATAADTEWFLAEGYTGSGFHTWLCLQNPGSEDADVEIYYFTQEGGPPAARSLTVPPNSRRTIWVNEDAGPDYQLSIGVSSDRPLVVERPMYFDYSGDIPGGHDVVGYSWG